MYERIIHTSINESLNLLRKRVVSQTRVKHLVLLPTRQGQSGVVLLPVQVSNQQRFHSIRSVLYQCHWI